MELISTEHKNKRFEVIDDSGRVYVVYGVNLYFSAQDDGQTIKVFVKKPKEDIK